MKHLLLLLLPLVYSQVSNTPQQISPQQASLNQQASDFHFKEVAKAATE